MALIDISMPLYEGMPAFPGDPPFRAEALRRLARGDPYELSQLSFGSHAGTHLDPPSHFLPDGASVDALDLEALNGPCEVVAVDPSRRSVGVEDLLHVRRGTARLLLRTANSARWAQRLAFFEDYVGLEREAAQRLVALGVRLVGIDALSVELDPHGGFPVHRELLGAGIAVLEGLLLGAVAPGAYGLTCLPLALRGGDGGPARAVLRSA